MLKLDQVEFNYPDAEPYLFDFEVAPGEVVGIAGSSGSGKSTLLDLVAGFQTPSGGSILLESEAIHHIVPEQRPVSILFQKDNVFSHLTAEQNVQLGSKKKIDVAARLHEVGLKSFATKRCTELSGGQQQRVALARTLARNQPILLLDEPFSALDSETAAEMRNLVKQLVISNNWHAILVSHHKEDFAAMAHRTLYLKEQQLVEID